ncbi:MAG: hypothetical protein SGILL_002983 [Bacillariaceae sp.]
MNDRATMDKHSDTANNTGSDTENNSTFLNRASSTFLPSPQEGRQMTPQELRQMRQERMQNLDAADRHQQWAFGIIERQMERSHTARLQLDADIREQSGITSPAIPRYQAMIQEQPSSPAGRNLAQDSFSTPQSARRSRSNNHQVESIDRKPPPTGNPPPTPRTPAPAAGLGAIPEEQRAPEPAPAPADFKTTGLSSDDNESPPTASASPHGQSNGWNQPPPVHPPTTGGWEQPSGPASNPPVFTGGNAVPVGSPKPLPEAVQPQPFGFSATNATGNATNNTTQQFGSFPFGAAGNVTNDTTVPIAAATSNIFNSNSMSTQPFASSTTTGNFSSAESGNLSNFNNTATTQQVGGSESKRRPAETVILHHGGSGKRRKTGGNFGGATTAPAPAPFTIQGGAFASQTTAMPGAFAGTMRSDQLSETTRKISNKPRDRGRQRRIPLPK